jgi:hypothetical protein
VASYSSSGMHNAMSPIVLRLVAASVITTTLAALAATQITFFIVQPIGAVPDGRTVVIWRLKTMKFIDSADGWCEREVGGVNLLCRAGVLGKVGSEGVIIARLPYSETLYLWSTGGRTYSR